MDAATRQRLADGEACLAAALSYLSMGWSVLALCPPDHLMGPSFKGHAKDCKSPGKAPWHRWGEFQDRLPTEKEVRSWWDKVPTSNVGVALGPTSGIIRIDIEGCKGEEELIARSGGVIPETLEFISGRDDGTGRGLIYKVPSGVKLKTTTFKKGEKSELRFQARGAQTVLPPSRHVSGGLYRWSAGSGPLDMEITPAPEWLLAELSPTKEDGSRKTDEEWDGIVSGVDDGARDDSITAYFGKALLALRDIDNDGDLRMVMRLGRMINDNNRPPMTDDEVVKCFKSILRTEKDRRQREDLTALDKFVERQITVAVDKVPSGGLPPTTNGKAGPALPDWHLVMIESDPASCRLRAPEWKDSPLLDHGYLGLPAKDLLNWQAIRLAAFAQAHVIAPKKLKLGLPRRPPRKTPLLRHTHHRRPRGQKEALHPRLALPLRQIGQRPATRPGRQADEKHLRQADFA